MVVMRKCMILLTCLSGFNYIACNLIKCDNFSQCLLQTKGNLLRHHDLTLLLITEYHVRIGLIFPT